MSEYLEVNEEVKPSYLQNFFNFIKITLVGLLTVSWVIIKFLGIVLLAFLIAFTKRRPGRT